MAVGSLFVPEPRRFTESAKADLATLAWLTAQQTLAHEQAGKPGMNLAAGIRGAVLYDRVLIRTFNPESSSTNVPCRTITGAGAEKALSPLFQTETPVPAERQPCLAMSAKNSSPSNRATGGNRSSRLRDLP